MIPRILFWHVDQTDRRRGLRIVVQIASTLMLRRSRRLRVDRGNSRDLAVARLPRFGERARDYRVLTDWNDPCRRGPGAHAVLTGSAPQSVDRNLHTVAPMKRSPNVPSTSRARGARGSPRRTLVIAERGSKASVDYARTRRRASSADTLTLHMAPGGGFAAHFAPR
jgi:hypothetical protein